MRLILENMVITCIQCEKEFEFSIDEQIRHRKMNFDDPKRCHSCRKKIKINRLAE